MVATRTSVGSQQTDVMSVRHRAQNHFFMAGKMLSTISSEGGFDHHVRSRTSSSPIEVVSLVNKTGTMEGNNAWVLDGNDRSPSAGINGRSTALWWKSQGVWGERRHECRAVDACRRQISRTGITMHPQRLSCAFRWLCDVHLGSACEWQEPSLDP
jgi:hypothetical protein